MTRTISPNNALQLRIVYELLECIHALLPQANEDERANVKAQLEKIKNELPDFLKKTLPQRGATHIEHNLSALIAMCDASENQKTPFFTKIPHASGSSGPSGGLRGGGYGGGGIF